MTTSHRYPVPEAIAAQAHVAANTYESRYRQSIVEPESFWAEQAQNQLTWRAPWHTVLRHDFRQGLIRWFEGGQLNVCENCLDRHLEQRADQTAILWEGDQPGQRRALTYRELYLEVCRFANVLKSHGVGKGDRVCLYLPMIPEAAIAMLACARIGAVHSVVFAGFSAEALRDRIIDADCKLLILADEGRRGGKTVPLKANADRALAENTPIQSVLVVKNTGAEITWHDDRDVWWHEAMAEADSDCPVAIMDAEDSLFILYTSGSTGKPKGLVHTSGGYLLYAAMTFHDVFDYHDGDIYWCSADVGWVTGHSYVVYGPLACGATTLMFEGVPTYPEADRFWRIVDHYRVNIFYTAPTAIRALMAQGDAFVTRTERSSLRILGTVGEPINPEAWEWYYRVVGDSRCPIVDTWWQTETGGIMITPLPGATTLKPGSATRPFFGIQPVILDLSGYVKDGQAEGVLAIASPWPGQARSI